MIDFQKGIIIEQMKCEGRDGFNLCYVSTVEICMLGSEVCHLFDLKAHIKYDLRYI